MPDSKGRFKGHGWTRAYGEGYDRVFKSKPLSENTKEVIRAGVEAAVKLYCNNSIETPRDQRCWSGEEGHKRLAHSVPETSSASTTRVANSSPSSKARGGESSQ